MPTLRLCSFNGEWTNDWFTGDHGPAAFKPTFTRDGHTSDTQQTAGRSAALLTAIDPDIVALQEAPSRAEELALFIATFLADAGVPRYQFLLGDSGAAQKLALLYKPSAVTSAQRAPSATIDMPLSSWEADVDGDGFLNAYQFTRKPLVVNLQLGNDDLQIIVMRTK
jgi:hypothetical protein